MNENPLHNKFSLVKGAARRARQLQAGSPAMMATNSMKACRVAEDEIRLGHVSYVVGKRPLKAPVEPDL